MTSFPDRWSEMEPGPEDPVLQTRWSLQIKRIVAQLALQKKLNVEVVSQPTFRGFSLGQQVSYAKSSGLGASVGTVAFFLRCRGDQDRVGIDIGQPACVVVLIDAIAKIVPIT